MKEYKVVTLKLGFRNRTQNFEDLFKSICKRRLDFKRCAYQLEFNDIRKR